MRRRCLPSLDFHDRALRLHLDCALARDFRRTTCSLLRAPSLCRSRFDWGLLPHFRRRVPRLLRLSVVAAASAGRASTISASGFAEAAGSTPDGAASAPAYLPIPSPAIGSAVATSAACDAATSTASDAACHPAPRSSTAHGTSTPHHPPIVRAAICAASRNATTQRTASDATATATRRTVVPCAVYAALEPNTAASTASIAVAAAAVAAAAVAPAALDTACTAAAIAVAAAAIAVAAAVTAVAAAVVARAVVAVDAASLAPRPAAAAGPAAALGAAPDAAHHPSALRATTVAVRATPPTAAALRIVAAGAAAAQSRRRVQAHHRSHPQRGAASRELRRAKIPRQLDGPARREHRRRRHRAAHAVGERRRPCDTLPRRRWECPGSRDGPQRRARRALGSARRPDPDGAHRRDRSARIRGALAAAALATAVVALATSSGAAAHRW